MTVTPQVVRLVSPDVPSPESVASQPILITEQQFALSTAAALSARPTTMRRPAEARRSVLAALRRIFLTPTPDPRAPRQDCPQRYFYLEHSCMARAMDRL
jgi:hypothetical protein